MTKVRIILELEFNQPVDLQKYTEELLNIFPGNNVCVKVGTVIVTSEQSYTWHAK